MVTKRSDMVDAMIDAAILNGRSKRILAAGAANLSPGIIDRIAGRLSPGWYARRQRSRMAAAVMSGGYDVVKNNRTHRRVDVSAGGSADNAADDRTRTEIVELVRYFDRNNPLLRSVVDRAADNITAPEYLFTPASGDEKFDTAAAEMLQQARAAAEMRGIYSFQDILYLGMRAMFTDGDFYLHLLTDGKVQVLEAHELVTPLGQKGYKDRRIVGGVELDRHGRHVAYYIKPPDMEYAYGRVGWVDDWKKLYRLDAANVLAVVNRTRFSQTRGMPVLDAALKTLEHFDSYLDAEQIAAKLDAMRVFAIKRPQATGPLPGISTYNDPAAGNSSTVSSYEKMLRAEPGMIMDLLAGEEIQTTGGQRPGDTFEPYIVTVIRMIGASVGFPLELVLLDFSRTNYSSARAALLQAYRVFMRHQVFLREHLIKPWYRWQMNRWIAAGALPPIDNAYKLKFTPPRWAWIDPLKAVLAKQKEVEAGAATITDWITERGELPEQVFAVRQRELQWFRDNDVPTSTAPDNLRIRNVE